MSSVLSTSSFPKLSYWTIVISNDAKGLGVEAQMVLQGKALPTKPARETSIPNEKSHTYVDWDYGRVASIDEKPLYSTKFSSCLAVLGRAYKKSEDTIAYTSLNHVFTRATPFKTTLQTLVEKIEGLGKIEFFITGGMRPVSLKLAPIDQAIAESALQNEGITYHTQDNTCGIADLGDFIAVDSSTKLEYSGTTVLTEVGFDTHGNPFQIIGAHYYKILDGSVKLDRAVW